MTILIIVGIIVLLGIIFASMYNSLVKLRNNRENAFADIDVQLKQRHDLIPQLVDTVKGYAAHEKETGTVETQSADYSGSAVFGFRRIACVFNFCN